MGVGMLPNDSAMCMSAGECGWASARIRSRRVVAAKCVTCLADLMADLIADLGVAFFFAEDLRADCRVVDCGAFMVDDDDAGVGTAPLPSSLSA